MDLRADRRFILSASLLVFVFLLAGCASVEPFRPPEPSLTKIAYLDTDLSGVTIFVAFNVVNPNPRPIEIVSMRYTLDLNGYRIGTGSASGQKGPVGNPPREKRMVSRWLDWIQRTPQPSGATEMGIATKMRASEEMVFGGGFKMSFLQLPMAIRAVFKEEAVHARVVGQFTVATGRNKFQELPFDSATDVPVTLDFWTGN